MVKLSSLPAVKHCPTPPRPPAWMMLPVSDLTTPLSTIISVSGKE
ncbi:Rz1 family lipoprotein [Candidatus Fukatsuia symbiotica]|uniref:Uncharacterized protein n=1 Tax=Candidatus Fukatsuia symbiotica TaxID=1878942 RepID=A0A2U8I6E3_9GAMM|nr:hypothetical protein CCS41_09900 [Candidatus Fukatsuia symbiotica]